MREQHHDEFFWNHPLAFWLHDCARGDPPLLNEREWRSEERLECPIIPNEVLDGLLMTSLMNYISPSDSNQHEVVRSNEFRNQFRLQNLLVRIVQFYKSHLDQLVVCQLPSVKMLIRSDEKSIAELKKVILLLLGCAIQSDKKKVFVERITRFDQHTQAGLANYIQQLTEGTSIVVSATRTDRDGFFRVLETVMRERDALIEMAHDIDNDSDSAETNTNSSSNSSEICPKDSYCINRPCSPSAEVRSLKLQLANANHETRQVRSQAENKDDECRKLEVELEEKSKRITCLENERLRLLEKEREVKRLNDELQAANCRIEKLRSLEGFEKKFREASEARDLLKSKYEAVTEKYRAQEELSAELEKSLTSLQIENHDRSFLEETQYRLKSTLSDLESEIEKKNMEIEMANEENYRLSQELREREERINQLELASATNTPRIVDSLADQLENAKQDEFELMKAEIRKLRAFRAQTEGAMPENRLPSPQHVQEIEELTKKLASEELKSAEFQLEVQKLQVEREQIDGNLERIGIELEETSVQVENMRMERDDAVKALHDARRKFSQFQTEFGKRMEEETECKIRAMHFELDELKKKLHDQQENETEVAQQLTKIKEENRGLLFEVDEVNEEKKELENSLSKADRNRKSLEAERDALKAKLDSMEDAVEEMKLQLLNSEVSQKRLDEKDSLIERLHDEKADLENELRMTQQQLKIETKKTQRLREDLVSEKSKKADLVGRLRSLCTTLKLNGANMNVDDMNDDKLIDDIDDIMMNALAAAKRETDALRIRDFKQLADLADLKKDIEKLKRSESESLVESDDRVRELTTENLHTKEQVFVLQEKVRELNLELSTKNDEIKMAKSSIEELNRNSIASCSNNAEIARLQVSIRNSQIQEDLVKQENVSLRDELQNIQRQNSKKAQNLDELEVMHKTLLKDHSRLQQLHNLLTRDYDEVKKESIEMRQKLQALPKQQAAFMSSNIQELEAKLSMEISKREQQRQYYLELEREHSSCRSQLEALRRDLVEAIKSSHDLTSELRRAQETCAHHTITIEELRKQLNLKLAEISKLNAKTEALSQLNRAYNEENKNLSRQLEILMNQNKELLQRALHDKDQYHLEMKDFQDQLSALRRHKEKLEDKIMDQYRTMESKKTPERKQPLVKRAAKALINRKRVTSNNGSTTEDSSVYSADERCSPPLASGAHPDDNDNLPPTCSSSDDHERISPNFNEMVVPPISISSISHLRSRNDMFGGSMRISPHSRRFAHSLDYEGNHQNQYSPSLPPRTPIRNSSATSSLRIRRPPPPPYTPQQSQQRYRPNENNNESMISTFEPKSHSTPKKEEDREVVREGEQRTNVRDKDERIDKTLSYYENVNNCSEAGDKSNESTIWYEYGCV